jgi:phosphatidylserine/phosphatidylglycerophosphate/cardiolipin synthase-like enzyme
VNWLVCDPFGVITSSFNFTEAREHDNSKEHLVIRSRELAKVIEDRAKRKGRAERYVRS